MLKIEASVLDVVFIFLFLVNTDCFYPVQDMSYGYRERDEAKRQAFIAQLVVHATPGEDCVPR